MKKKSIIVISIIITLLIIGIISSIIIINKNKNKEEFDKQEKIHNRYIKISEKINSIIDDSIKPIEEVIKKDIGEDKTKIDELNVKKAEVLKYKIKINNKKIKDLNKLKEENKKIEKSLNDIDEKLINLKNKEIENYTINEEHQINILSNEITKLIEEVNTLATKQAEKKAQEELKQKILNGDLSSFEGTYKMNENVCLTIKNNAFILSCGSEKTYKSSEMKKITQENDGSYKFLISSETKTLIFGDKFNSETFFNISSNAKKITFCEDLGCLEYTK